MRTPPLPVFVKRRPILSGVTAVALVAGGLWAAAGFLANPLAAPEPKTDPRVNWEHPSPEMQAEITRLGGPVGVYRLMFNHFKGCAVRDVYTTGSGRAKVLEPKAAVEQNCKPYPSRQKRSPGSAGHPIS